MSTWKNKNQAGEMSIEQDCIRYFVKQRRALMLGSRHLIRKKTLPTHIFIMQ